MSTNDETQTTNTTKMSVDDDRDTTWMDTNRRGQIVYRPRRFRGLTGREGFADYVEQAYWVARELGLLEELAALPSLEGKTVTEIAGLTRALGARIRERMWTFHDGYGPNLYYGALTRMVAAAKEDVSPTTSEAAGDAALQRRQTMGGVESSSPLPALPTSPLIRQSGDAAARAAAAAETVSDSEIDMGRAALRDVKHAIAASAAERWAREAAENDGDMVIRSTAAIQAMLAARIATAAAAGGWSDISGHPFIRAVSGVGDDAGAPALPAEDGDRHSDEDSASVEGDDDEVTGSGDEEADADGDEEADADGADADTEGGDGDEEADADAEGDGHVAPAPPPAALHQNIGIELPLWAWLAILAAFTAWAALVNGVLSRDLGCRPFGR
jgi:hypothetical protein